jgi:hypothetical protein
MRMAHERQPGIRAERAVEIGVDSWEATRSRTGDSKVTQHGQGRRPDGLPVADFVGPIAHVGQAKRGQSGVRGHRQQQPDAGHGTAQQAPREAIPSAQQKHQPAPCQERREAMA